MILIPVFFLESRRFLNSQTFIYTKWVNLCIFLKDAYFLIMFVICLLLRARYILIIQEIPAFSIYLIVELIFWKFSIRFQGPKFFNSLSREIQNSESISLFGKRVKALYSLLSYTPFLFRFSLSFFFFLSLFFKRIIQVFVRSVPLTCIVYPIVPGSLLFISPWLLYRLPCHYHFKHLIL